jgi:hypothetical protein
VALCSRLEELEGEVSAILSSPINALHSPSRDVSARGGSSSQNGGSVRKVSELPSFRKELMVITGEMRQSAGLPFLACKERGLREGFLISASKKKEVVFEI